MNKATRINVSVFSTIFGISGLSHGFFEILQGSKETPGFFIMAIGEAQKMWVHGDEPAFTLIPNYMFSGIVSVILGLSIIVWSIRFVHLKHGSIVLLLLFILLLLSGGGIAQVLFFPWIFYHSTKINKQLVIKKNAVSDIRGKYIAKLWPVSLIIGSTMLVLALIIATTGFVPGISNQDNVFTVMLSLLGMFIVAFLLSLYSGLKLDARNV